MRIADAGYKKLKGDIQERIFEESIVVAALPEPYRPGGGRSVQQNHAAGRQSLCLVGANFELVGSSITKKITG